MNRTPLSTDAATAAAGLPDQDRLQLLPAALRAHAHGILTAEAAVELLIANPPWLQRRDFVVNFIDNLQPQPGNTPMATVNWATALTALDAGNLPCSSGEGQLLRIAASLAEGIPVDLRTALTDLDTTNTAQVAQAVLHAAGSRS